MAKRLDITLHIDGIDPGDLSRVYSTVSHVATGFLLDGLRVTLTADNAEGDLFAGGLLAEDEEEEEHDSFGGND